MRAPSSAPAWPPPRRAGLHEDGVPALSPRCPHVVPALSPCHPRPPARAPQSPGCTGAAGGVRGLKAPTVKAAPQAAPPPAHLRMVAAKPKPGTTPAAVRSSICCHLSQLVNQTWGGGLDWAAAPARCLPQELCTQGQWQPCSEAVLGQDEVAKPEAKPPRFTPQPPSHRAWPSPWVPPGVQQGQRQQPPVLQSRGAVKKALSCQLD